MKYLITESKMGSIIFKHLDNQDFVKIGGVESVYFANSENDEYAQIRFDKNDGVCFINFDLVEEISSLFSLEKPDSKKVIGKWVENTLQMKVTYTATDTPFHFPQLRIPHK